MKTELKTTAATKYYHFSQNNSGGSFIINDEVARHVIIEAHSAEEANRHAEDVGIYFDGCDSGDDCECCGDRWSREWDGTATPLIYDKEPAKYTDIFTKPGEPVCHVYHLDGTKTTHIKQEKEKNT